MLMVAEPVLGEEEKAALSRVLESGWITMGDRVREFELEFARQHGATDSVALGSCTAALHLILEALGIGPGDEVLVPSLTFVATANCVLYVGAKPVFVDIESLSLPLMSRSDAATKCTDRTKALILVHYAGYTIDREAWRHFASSRGLLLVEDAAHAAGASQAGTFGDAAAFSFYGNKNMTTAEGGAVLAKNVDVLAKIRQMRGHGLTTGTFQRRSSRISTYDVTMLGYNYRMDELRAAIGLVQLGHLSAWNERRRHFVQLYARRLKSLCPAVLSPFSDWHSVSNNASAHHIMPIVLPEGVERQHVVDKLRDSGIQTTIHYPPVHLLSLYREQFPSVRLAHTEEFARRELTLPLHPRMEDVHVEQVVSALADALGQGASVKAAACERV
jgi:dTDP-4-amino-4,6-dideoxygalactose transaminase